MPGYAVALVAGSLLARGQIDLSDVRQQFAGDSSVHGALFDAYVVGPAVTNAWNIR